MEEPPEGAEEAENKTPIAGGEAEPKSEAKPSSSLFPLFSISTPPPSSALSETSQWLCNPSFTAEVPSFPPSTAVPSIIPEESDEEEGGGGGAAAARPAPSYHLVDSPSPSPSLSEEDRRRKHGERSERKRKKKRRTTTDEEASRWSLGVRPLAGGSGKKPTKDCYFDVRGDPDNLFYGSLYRMDVARYKPHRPSDSSLFYLGILYRPKSQDTCLGMEGDVDVLDNKLREVGRYCSVRYSTLERHKKFKHVKVIGDKKSSVIHEEFIPLVELQSLIANGNAEVSVRGELEESWEDEIIRRTRELNKMSRELPHDEKVWLAFADFQDKIASMQPQKAARLQTLEKKISILEKAVELNPDNEELLLCLLKAYERRDSSEVLIERWIKILMRHSGSCKLWREFVIICQGEFSRFKVSDMRRTYAHAIQALSSTCSKLCRQVGQTANMELTDPDLVQLELGLVDIFISLCRFEWQSGYRELATGLFQAAFEYNLFCPSLLLSPQNKQRLFEHFWNSDGARIGEDGALGWSSWLEKEEDNRNNIIKEDIEQETEPGGWSGWSDPPSRKNENIEEAEDLAEDSGVDEKTEEDLGVEDPQHEDDVEVLLKKLGINVDAEPHTEVKSTETWNIWSQEELSRDNEQWMSVRENSEKEGHIRSRDSPDRESNEQLSRVILFEDVSDYLFSLCSKEARLRLVCRFIDFYGGKVSQWTCTNSESWTEDVLNLEMVPDSVFDYLGEASRKASRSENSLCQQKLEVLLGSSGVILRRSDVLKFLRNVILLCLNTFPRNYILEEAVLTVEELLVSQMNSFTCSVTPSRALAKSLLKNDRQDLLLCGLYARREAAYQNTDLARKILDMALLSIDGLPPDLRENAPLLYLWYAEMEMVISSSDSSEQSSLRTIHILSCLGGRVKYTPFKCQTPSLHLLRARQGFKEQIKHLRPTWARGDITDHSISLICCASLFEMLTTGWAAGIEVIEEAFSMALPERRSKSLQLESLCTYYIGLLQKHPKRLKLSRVFGTILQGLQIYPYNPKFFAAMMEVSSLYTVPHKIRRIFDEYSERKPSVIVLLSALSFELGRSGSQHRIRRLFERALANDKLQRSVILWRCYLAYEVHLASNLSAARRIFFRAIHACPWSKALWLEGFQKLSSILTAKELSDLQEVMRDKELNLRTDIYEILLQEET